MTPPILEEVWPPQSAKEALLSSPSGRKKFTDYQAGKITSPIRRTPGTPSLLDRLRLARKNQEYHTRNEEEDDDDEETLQLKLAAIEAKIRLKKLQSKAKKQDGTQSSRPVSATNDAYSTQAPPSSRIEVTLSPTKRAERVVEQISPSRVLLGIDKGIRGADVSLRRARVAGGGVVKGENYTSVKTGQSSANSKTQHRRKEKTPTSVTVKSFSERMAEVRDRDRSETDKREKASRVRATRFSIDAAEVDKFRAVAKESCSHGQSQPLMQNEWSAHDVVDNWSVQDYISGKHDAVLDSHDAADTDVGDASMFEGFSGLHLSTRILPHSFLKRTLPEEQFTIYRVPDLLKNITSPAYEIPDGVGDFVVFAIVGSNSSALNQKSQVEDRTKSSNEWVKKWEDGLQNTQKFMALTLTDLTWTINLYLFGTALPRYYRLSPGTVIAILNPAIMRPKKGQEDTGAFSLALHDGDDTILEIGTSKDLGYCKVMKKDGKECRQWVNATKTEICEWHLNAQIAKAQSKRMGVNAGANGFSTFGSQNGSGGKYGKSKAKQKGRGFDRESGSHYFISSSNTRASAAPIYNPHISTAKMLDADDHDPFIAEGQLPRDKATLLQKRTASLAKEREIAKKLATLGSATGAGADYMRRKFGDDGSHQKSGHVDRQQNRPIAASSPFMDKVSAEVAVSSLKEQMGRKRAAQDVRLSPVKKKTRFLTEKGIREAGQESMGANTDCLRPKNDSNDDDDDDDLDII